MITAVAHALVVLSLSLTSGVWPLDPRPEVVEGFSPPSTAWGAGHRGVDLLGHAGQVVRATQAGTITFAGKLAGRGVVVVDHGATRTTYEPVTAAVGVGDTVSAGASIGTLEMFGSHCWPRSCLHWGLIEGEAYLDPLSLLGAGRVRLLPLYTDLPLMGPGLIGPAAGLAAGLTEAPATPWVMFPRPGGGLGGRPGATGPW